MKTIGVIRLLLLVSIVITIIISGCDKDNSEQGNGEIKCTITNPQDKDTFRIGLTIPIVADINYTAGTSVEAYFFVDGIKVGNSSQVPYSCNFETDGMENGWHTIKVEAKTNYETTSADEKEIFVGVKVDSLKDYDGNIYKTVTIGNQEWMAENLKVTHYPDGTPIPYVTNNTEWGNLEDNDTSIAYCYYLNDTNSEYGALYTYAAAINVCPDGWHLPSSAEWEELVNYISDDGLEGQEGIALKSITGWKEEGSGTDIYSFSALPGGYRGYYYGEFDDATALGFWWSTDEYDSKIAYSRYLDYRVSSLGVFTYSKSGGFSVRCLKDN